MGSLKKLSQITTVEEDRRTINQIMEFFNRKATDKEKKMVLAGLGVGKDYFTCYLCGGVKARDEFYISTDPNAKTRVCRVCKECAEKIAIPIDLRTGNPGQASKESIMEALEYLDKPFKDKTWVDAVLAEKNSIASSKNNRYQVTSYSYYMRVISTMSSTEGLRWRDSDLFAGGVLTTQSDTEKEYVVSEMDTEVAIQYNKNKEDVFRLLGYEPFAEERIEDQPFLYSQLVGFLDANEDANEDQMRVQSIITIVRSFLQMNAIDNRISKLMADAMGIEKNASAIKTLQDSKRMLSTMITQLAAESCISMKNNKNAVKGENTITGKWKKLKTIGLRAAENNAFDIETCKGMQQVFDISNASIMKQIRLDENDYTEMLATQREMITKLQRELSDANEKARILLRENLDIKKYVTEQGIDLDSYSDEIELPGTAEVGVEEEKEDV